MSIAMASPQPRHLAAPARRRPARGRWARASSAGLALTVVELTAGLAFLGCAAVAGALFVRRPWENRLDVVAYNLIPERLTWRPYLDAAALGSTKVFVVGVLVLAVLGLMRDRARALACLVGPVAAVFVTERVAKPLVGRHGVLGGDSYPSGTVTAVTALAVVLVLVLPRLVKPLGALVGAAAVAVASVGVIGLRWHYGTDVIGGILVGAGAVLSVDAALRLPALAWRHYSRSKTAPREERQRRDLADRLAV